MFKKILFFIFLPLISFAQSSSFERGTQLYYQENYRQAKPHFETHLKSNPNHLKSIEYLGDIAAYATDWDTALNYYKILVDAHPNNANYNFKYGGVMGRKAQNSSRFRAALLVSDIRKHLEKAAQLDPNHIEARWALIDLYIALPSIMGGSETTALKFANELMKISEVDGHLTLGYIAEHFNRPADAERHYKRAIQIGQSPLTYQKLADLYENVTNEPEKSIAVREASAKKHQRNNINYQIGKISGMYNVELQKGLQYLTTYINNFTVKDGVPVEWAYFRKAQIYRHMGDKTNALKNIDQALALNKNFAEAQEERRIINRL